MAQELQVDESLLRFKQYDIEHHLAYTASAYFVSKWEHSAGFTLDGSGDFVTCMMSECIGDGSRRSTGFTCRTRSVRFTR